MNLFYRQVGEGQPIIILHGIFGSCDNWLTMSKSIAEKGYTVYAIDQRNHGRSPQSDVFDYESMAADLMGFIDAHAIQKPVLIGHSMGGKTVMNFAMRYPDTFSKLVVVDMATKFYSVHQTEILKGLAAIDLPALTNRNEADEILSSYEPNLSVRQFLLKNLYRNDDGQFDWRLNLPVISKNIALVGNSVPALRTISEPTLFMRGQKSNYVLDEDMPDIKKLFPNVVFDTIEGAGHWVQAEQPESFLKSLMAFL